MIDGVGQLSRVETTIVVDDPDERKRAIDARAKACKEIRDVCAETKFGLLCPTDREADLDAAVTRARAIVDSHNVDARCTRIAIYTIKGRIADSDQEAARSIASEITRILDAINDGIAKANPKAIRYAVKAAQEMGAMLAPEQVQTVSDAIEQARKAARTITKRVVTGGEDAIKVIQDIQRGAIERARFAFLDTDDSPAVATGEGMPQANAKRFADLECEPSPESPASPAPVGDVAGESPSGDSIAASA